MLAYIGLERFYRPGFQIFELRFVLFVVLLGQRVRGCFSEVSRSRIHAYPMLFVIEIGGALVEVFLGSLRSAVLVAAHSLSVSLAIINN
jgi:hypothetical protein